MKGFLKDVLYIVGLIIGVKIAIVLLLASLFGLFFLVCYLFFPQVL